jgi:hypothetical protein
MVNISRLSVHSDTCGNAEIIRIRKSTQETPLVYILLVYLMTLSIAAVM